jgi:hypothetical protein
MATAITLSRQWVEYTDDQPSSSSVRGGSNTFTRTTDSGRRQSGPPPSSAVISSTSSSASGASTAFYRWFKSRAVPLRDSKGGIVKWFGSNMDFEDQKQSEARLQSHLERLHLLDQTTRAIGERHDLGSIFRVMLAHLEDQLGIDFGCVCLHEPATDRLQVAAVGATEPVPRGSHRSAGADAHGRWR